MFCQYLMEMPFSVSQWQLRLFEETFEIDSFWSKKSFLFAFAKGQTSNHFETSTFQGGGEFNICKSPGSKVSDNGQQLSPSKRLRLYMHGK